jgi:uncharacterized protein (DUF1778 family)
MAKSIHFRVADKMHNRISEEAEAMGVSLAEFCREAAVARAAVWAAKRARSWGSEADWKPVVEYLRRTGMMDDLK